MKRTLLAFCLFAGLSFGASAQCTPDTTHFNSTTKVYPASLPTITTGVPFTGTVTLQVPDTLDANTFVSQVPAGQVKAIIDSIQISTISGMPTGITAATSPALNTWLQHHQYSCTTFSGTAPNSNASGDYNLTIAGTGCGHFTFNGTPYSSCQAFTFTRAYPYKLTVNNPTTGVQDILNGAALSIYPNPNNGSCNVTISTADHITGDMIVMDALGRTVHTETIDVTGTAQIAISLNNVSTGIYMLVVNTANGKAVRQFSVK